MINKSESGLRFSFNAMLSRVNQAKGMKGRKADEAMAFCAATE
jgi:hypothetical protein